MITFIRYFLIETGYVEKAMFNAHCNIVEPISDWFDSRKMEFSYTSHEVLHAMNLVSQSQIAVICRRKKLSAHFWYASQLFAKVLGVWYNVLRLIEKHLQLKSCEISFAHKLCISCPIGLKCPQSTAERVFGDIFNCNRILVPFVIQSWKCFETFSRRSTCTVHVGGFLPLGSGYLQSQGWPRSVAVTEWGSCQIRKTAGCACAGNAGNGFAAIAG